MAASSYIPSYVVVSARQGEPSILWIAKSGRYYRTRYEAIEDDKAKAYDYKAPVDVKKYWYLLGVIVIVIGVIMYFKKRKNGK